MQSRGQLSRPSGADGKRSRWPARWARRHTRLCPLLLCGEGLRHLPASFPGRRAAGMALQSQARAAAAQDNANDPLYVKGYHAGDNGGFGFTPFQSFPPALPGHSCSRRRRRKGTRAHRLPVPSTPTGSRSACSRRARTLPSRSLAASLFRFPLGQCVLTGLRDRPE